MAAPVYLDACVHYRLAQALRGHGFTVSTAVDEHTTRLDDESQLRYAAERGWLLVTHNERHFRALHAAALREGGQAHAGIWSYRPLHRSNDCSFGQR